MLAALLALIAVRLFVYDTLDEWLVVLVPVVLGGRAAGDMLKQVLNRRWRVE